MKGECIVREIQLKNFRSLKDTGLQTLSPITLLVGENSSGKSTFLRAFPLLKQSISKRTSGPILWAGDVDDYVDFGSFEETVTNDKSTEITFRFKFKIKDLGLVRRWVSLEYFFADTEDTSDSVNSDIDYEMTIASSKGKDFVSSLRLTINSFSVYFDLLEKTITTNGGLKYTEPKTPSNSGKGEKDSRRFYGRIVSVCRTFGFVLPCIEELWDIIFENILTSEQEEIDQYNFRQILVDIGYHLSRSSDIKTLDTQNKTVGKYPYWYIEEYNNTVINMLANPNEELNEMLKLCFVYKIISEIDEYILQYFKQVHYIAPLRATAERYYRLRNLAVDEVDYQGKNLAIFINSLTSKQIKEFHEWTNEHFGFTVSTNKSRGHLSLEIQLKNSEKAINLSDTGFGYSQVLPIITQLWELSSQKTNKVNGSRNTLPLVIAIEQPELHLHPAVQARLAKAFIASINLARKNGYELQLLLETHSETIVNYLGRAISRGMLQPEDVSVILFEKNPHENVTTVMNSSYDEYGYLTNWPYGFFDSED